MWDAQSFLTEAHTMLFPMVGWALIVCGFCMTITGAFQVLKYLMDPAAYPSWSSTITLVVIGGASVLGGTWLLNIPNRSPDPEPSPSPSASPTQTPTQAPSVPPAEPATPVDLTWLWITLGIAAVLTVLIVGTLVTVILVKRLRRASAADAERQRIEQARKERLERAWQSWLDRHQVIKDRVLEAETDWDLIFHYPSLSDPTIPQTRDLHRALRAADTADQSMPADLDERTQIDQLTYPKLVLQAEEAWQLAYSFAKRTGQKLLPRQERKTIEQIIKLLNIAKNAGGSSSERDVAYARAQKLIQSLRVVKVPERAMLAIEQEQRLMLEASAQPQQAAMSAPEDTSKTPIVL